MTRGFCSCLSLYPTEGEGLGHIDRRGVFLSLYPTEGQGLTFFIIWREVFLSLYPMEGHVSKFLVADDYRLDPSYNPPFTKSDDVEANEKQEFRCMNIYYSFLT